MLIEPFLRRFVVVRTDAQDATDAAPVGLFHLFDDGGGVVTATIFQDWHASFVHTFHHLRDLVLFLFRQTRGFCRCRENAQEVCTIVELISHQLFECGIIHFSLRSERSDEGDAQTFAKLRFFLHIAKEKEYSFKDCLLNSLSFIKLTS